MIDMLSADELAERTSRAAAAAATAGRDLGLEVTEPTVLYDAFSVVVHLAPSPVVARVPTVHPPTLLGDLDARAAQQRTELDVASWLAGRGLPVVPPSPLVPREPVRRDGFSMTFWTYVDTLDGEPDYTRNAAAVAPLHAALRDYPGELDFLSVVWPTIDEAGPYLEAHPELLDPQDLDRARREWEVLAPVVGSRAGFEAAFPEVDIQPLHGDAPTYNIISTPRGELYSDFEVVTLGPAEWDLALVGPDGVAAYNARAAQLGLRQLDERVLRVMECAGMLRGIACLELVPQLPMLAEGIRPLIENWRASPFAGGM